MASRSPPPFKAQLATLSKTAPEGAGWIHEPKYDGYRIGCAIVRGRATLFSRNGKDWTANFPEIRVAAEGLSVESALLDGELAVVLADSRTSFQALQNSLSGASRARLTYFAFDLLFLDGNDVSRRPLLERKESLRKLLSDVRGPIVYAGHVEGRGADVLREACRLGLEGIVSKRSDLPYAPGRGGGWIKVKCVRRQEFVIGGFTDPVGSREGIGALLVGYHEGDALRFAGKVGTGFTRAAANALRARLDHLRRQECPFTPAPTGSVARVAHWVRPALVGEVQFTEWTRDGKFRHPSFQGLRQDKEPAEVIRERESLPPAPGRRGVRPTSSRSAPRH